MSTQILRETNNPTTWSDARPYDGHLWALNYTTITAVIGWLRPQARHTVTLDITATTNTPSAPLVATIQGTPHLIPTAGNLWTNQYLDPSGPTLDNADGSGFTPGPTPPVGASLLIQHRDHFNRGVPSRPVDATHTYRCEFTGKRLGGTLPLCVGLVLDQCTAPSPYLYGQATKIAELGDGWARYRRDMTLPSGSVTAWPFMQLEQSRQGGSTVWAVADLVWRDLTTTPDVTSAGTVSQTVDAAQPVTLALSNWQSGDVTVTVTTPDDIPDNPEPCDVLALDVWAPVPTQALRWDLDRWDRALWDTPRPLPGALVWDTGVWGGARWWDTSQDTWWAAILGPSTTVTTRRGMSASGPVLKADAGTLSVTATDNLDPRALGLVYGAPIRLYHWPTRTAIWTGYVTDVTITPIKDGGYTVALDAADDVAQVVAVTRYGARSDSGGPETWHERLARLMASAPTVPVTVAADSSAMICPTVWETSLAAHLDALVASTGGWWTGNRWGGITIAATPPDTSPVALLTDQADAVPGRAWRYTAGPSSWSSSKLIAALKATTHTAAPDDKGEWRATDQTWTVTDPSTTAAWGGTTAAVDLLTPDEATTRVAAARLLRRATDAPPLTSATIRPVSRRTRPVSRRTRPDEQAADMADAAALDPGQPVATRARDETGAALIAAVAHTITPTTWTTDLTLTSQGDPQ